MKLTIYYAICLSIVNGKIISHKERSLPLNSITADVPSENYDTIVNVNPRKSDFVHHPDISNSTTVSNGDTINQLPSDILNSDDYQRMEEIEKYKHWPISKPEDAITNNGTQIVLKSETPVGFNQVNLHRNNLKRSAGSDWNGNSVPAMETIYRDVMRIKNPTKGNSVVKLLSNERTLSKLLRRRRSADINVRRRKRGFRSSVADRIAHGFGKRVPLSGLSDADLRGRVHDTLGKPELNRARGLLSLQPEDFDDEIEPLLALYEKLLAKVPASSER